MRIVTYNIQYWTGMDRTQDPERTLAAIREMNPDIIALQEVVHPFAEVGGRPILERVAQALGGEYVFGQIWAPGELPHLDQPMGLALVSRFPILAHANHKLSHTGPTHPRRLLEMRVLLPGDRELTLYVTHLEWRTESVREEQVRSLLQWTTRDRGRPHLLLGDFNSVHPEDVARYEESGGRWEEFVDEIEADFPQAAREPRAIPRILKAGYVDAFLAVGEGDGRTYTTAQPLLRLDYCFVDPSLAAALQRARRWDTELGRTASDHFPLVVDMDW